MATVEKVCALCGKEFSSQYARQVTCSFDCAVERRKILSRWSAKQKKRKELMEVVKMHSYKQAQKAGAKRISKAGVYAVCESKVDPEALERFKTPSFYELAQELEKKEKEGSEERL